MAPRLNHVGQLADVGGGQVAVAVLAGQLDDGRRAQAAVEVVVQQRLGHAPGQGLVADDAAVECEARSGNGAARCSQLVAGYTAACSMQWRL